MTSFKVAGPNDLTVRRRSTRQSASETTQAPGRHEQTRRIGTKVQTERLHFMAGLMKHTLKPNQPRVARFRIDIDFLKQSECF
jgi:hypothetical protein